MSVEESIPIVNVHTPQASFAIVHSCEHLSIVRTPLSPHPRLVTQETLDGLLLKISQKIASSPEGRNTPIGQGWVKYDWNDNVWNLDDGKLFNFY